jgi:predicted nucleic acid-binding protein
MPGSFIDTNVLIYLASAESRKADVVERLLQDTPVISVQVLNEMANVARRKMGLSWPETRDFLSLIQNFTKIEPLTRETHELGVDLSERYQLSIYDGMIVAAGLLGDCDILWSEDMQDGMLIAESIKITNPFSK